jgi:hypothetical protein
MEVVDSGGLGYTREMGLDEVRLEVGWEGRMAAKSSSVGIRVGGILAYSFHSFLYALE